LSCENRTGGGGGGVQSAIVLGVIETRRLWEEFDWRRFPTVKKIMAPTSARPAAPAPAPIPALTPKLSPLLTVESPANEVALAVEVVLDTVDELALVGVVMPVVTGAPLSPPPSAFDVILATSSLPECVAFTANVVCTTIVFTSDDVVDFEWLSVVELSDVDVVVGVGVTTCVEVTTTVDWTVVVLFAFRKDVDVMVEYSVDMDFITEATELVSRTVLVAVSHSNAKVYTYEVTILLRTMPIFSSPLRSASNR
jgi:hypothetical protein